MWVTVKKSQQQNKNNNQKETKQRNKQNPQKTKPKPESLIINWYKSSVWAIGLDFELQWGILVVF